jgi:hypothetical protein
VPTLDLTDDEADAVRSALAHYANRMGQAYGMYPHEDYAAQAELCEDVVEKLNKAEGRE